MFYRVDIFLISLGGQAPHVRPMWALNTCGEPNEIALTIRVLADCFVLTGLFQVQGRGGAQPRLDARTSRHVMIRHDTS